MGRALLSCAVERLSARGYTSCHLWVLVENVRSRRFYELAGFSAVPSSVKLIDIGTASLPEIRYRRSLGMRSKLVWDIRVDDLSSDAVRDLVRMHLEGMHAHSPAESVFALNLSGLTASYVTVWTAWHGGAIAGMGALKDLGGHVGEIKSMRTHPNFLRRGVASALLDHIIDVARSKAMVRLSLETGTGSYFEPALTLYRRRGFVDGNEFADYKRSAFNQFLHLTL
jgi:putative acetyltransferase